MTKEEIFAKMIEENLTAGIDRGFSLMLESLDSDIAKGTVLAEHSVNDVIDCLVESYISEE